MKSASSYAVNAHPSRALDIAAHPCAHPSFDQFVATIAALRAPDGCPWDREQTHKSIAHNMIEEAYEAVDAIEAEDVSHLREELGDVLLQVVLQSQIAADAGLFDINDVCADVNEKMVRRHPHVFGEEQADNASKVLDLWDQVKLTEKVQSDKQSDQGTEDHVGLLDGVPASFPALMQAQKISRKAASVGFDWDSVDGVWEKVREEILELKEAYYVAPKSKNGKVDASAEGSGITEKIASVEEEFGDVLFSLVNVARRMGIDAEGALRITCSKFRSRWAFIEDGARTAEKSIESLSAEELEDLWSKAKTAEQRR